MADAQTWIPNLLAALKSLFSSRKTQIVAYTTTIMALTTMRAPDTVRCTALSVIGLLVAVLVYSIALEDAAAKGNPGVIPAQVDETTDVER